MNEIGEKFLPLGTVVILKGAEKRLMITGFCTMAAEDEDGLMYDYSGCLYPEGMISSDETALFNHDQIEKIYHVGLSDQEEKDFKIKLKQLLYANSVVTETAPTNIQDQPGLNVINETHEVEDLATENPTEDDLTNIPPIGPGLPGYVEPKTEEKVVEENPLETPQLIENDILETFNF